MTGLPAPRRLRGPSPRLRLMAMLVAAVAWAFAWGAHDHGVQAIPTDLSLAEVSRRIEVDASTGSLDLAGIALEPGEVVEFVLKGSAGAAHAFVLTGATPGASIDQRVNADGDSVVRLRAPESGALSFVCAIPGHEGLHGNLFVGAGVRQ